MKKDAWMLMGVFLIIGMYILLRGSNLKHTDVAPPYEQKQPSASLMLTENGLAAVSFGETPEQALATLTPILGAPTKDTGWVASFSTYGTCPGNSVRGLEWNNLHLLFGDTIFGEKKFFGFQYLNRADAYALKTEKGVALGATKEEIEAVYPTATFGDWLPGQTGTTFVKGVSGDGKYLGGTLEDNKLFWIGGGILCGE